MLYPVFQLPINKEKQYANNETNPKFIYKEGYFFNFEKGDFEIDGTGKTKIATDYEAWKQWCNLQLSIERYCYLAYSNIIGVEFENAFSQPTKKAQESMVEKTITEALLVDPYKRTLKIADFKHSWLNDSLYTEFTVYGKENTSFQLSQTLNLGG